VKNNIMTKVIYTFMYW